MDNESSYVKVKDLQVGKMYGGFRNWHVYLGRTVDKGFMWLYIGNPEQYIQDPIPEIRWSLNYEYGLNITKNNKRIKLSPGELGEYWLNLSILPKEIINYLRYRGLVI